MAARLTGDKRIWNVELRGLPIQPSLGIDDPVQRQNHSLVNATRRRNLRADLLDDESVAPAFQFLRVDAECAEVNRKAKALLHLPIDERAAAPSADTRRVHVHIQIAAIGRHRLIDGDCDINEQRDNADSDQRSYHPAYNRPQQRRPTFGARMFIGTHYLAVGIAVKKPRGVRNPA